MKKILFVILLTFTTFANADEGRYTMVQDEWGVYILDTQEGELKYCKKIKTSNSDTKVTCSDWSENDPL